MSSKEKAKKKGSKKFISQKEKKSEKVKKQTPANFVPVDTGASSVLSEAIFENAQEMDIMMVLDPTPSKHFVETPFTQEITQRALNYIKAGFPVHLRGTSGVGKTTLALRLAQIIGRPVVIIHGDEELRTSDLIGSETGYSVRTVRDNFIHSVLKTEEDASKRWADSRLTTAVENGLTLIYDEFTRSRPEANNVLLSVLQEGILTLPAFRPGGGHYLKVNPEFRAIFTSNPEEYVGVHKAQDALRDRMITLDLMVMDEHTEIAITQRQSDRLSMGDASKIVKVVRALRDSAQVGFSPTVRACIMIARCLGIWKTAVVSREDAIFRKICLDILTSGVLKVIEAEVRMKVEKIVNAAIDKYCAKSPKVPIRASVSSLDALSLDAQSLDKSVER